MAKYFYNKHQLIITNTYYEPGWVFQGTAVHGWFNCFTAYSFNSANGKYTLAGTSYRDKSISLGSIGYSLVGDTLQQLTATKHSSGNDVESTSYTKAGGILSQTSSAGALVQSGIIAEEGTYPNNGRHTDGFWYVRGALANAIPTISLTTSDNRTLYESDTFNIVGSATDTDAGNVVSVKYQVNEGTIRAISTGISTGASIPFSKSLTYKAGTFYDGSTIVSATLAENANHTLKVWAEDDQGGKSAVQTRTFKVVANRPPTITFNPFSAPTGLINTDNITVSGSVSDPDGNTVSVKFKIGNGSYTDVYSGAGGTFSFDVNLALLTDGPNAITVQAVDSYGALTQKALNIAKSLNAQPLKTSVTRYKLTPPNASAKGVLLWVERDAVDVTVTAEISMTAAGETELFVPMTKSVTAYVGVGIEEDEFTYEAADPKENIVIKLTQTRANTATNNGITLISGVLS